MDIWVISSLRLLQVKLYEFPSFGEHVFSFLLDVKYLGVECWIKQEAHIFYKKPPKDFP